MNSRLSANCLCADNKIVLSRPEFDVLEPPGMPVTNSAQPNGRACGQCVAVEIDIYCRPRRCLSGQDGPFIRNGPGKSGHGRKIENQQVLSHRCAPLPSGRNIVPHLQPTGIGVVYPACGSSTMSQFTGPPRTRWPRRPLMSGLGDE